MCRYAALLIVLTAALPAFAEERSFDADATSKAVAPFLDERTVALLHIDLDAIEVDALVKKAELVATLEPAEKAIFKAALSNTVDTLRKAGAHDVFVIVSLADLPAQGPFVVVPVGKNSDATAVAEVVKQIYHLVNGVSAEMNGAVVFGAEATVKRLAKLEPTPRPEIRKALAASGNATAHLVLVPTTDARKILEEVLPKLPPELGLGDTSVKVLTHGFLWAALKFESEPAINVEAIVQSEENTAAKDLRDLIAKIFRMTTKDPEAKVIVREFPQLLELMTPKVDGDRLVLKLEEKTIVRTVKPAVDRIRASAFRMQSSNNLKQIVLAAHNYHDTHGRFPAIANFDAKGRPLLSWRVHLLPYLEQDQLYKEFHLDEPWDSEHNIRLVKRMPKIFVSSKDAKLAEQGQTTYVTIVDKSTMFTGGKDGIKIAEVLDGTSNTIFCVDADDTQAVIWTKPDDLKLDPNDAKKGLGGRFVEGILAAMVDGSVRMLPATITKETLHALFTRNGGEVVELP
jgi:hypothetical protein